MFDLSNLNSSDWQHITYSSIIVIVLSASLFSRKEMSIAKIIKYLLIWAVIAIFGVWLYSYRYEFANFKDRLISEINPTNPIVKNNQLIINLADDGHFYIDVEINQKPVRFMIDTGASDIVLSLKDAQKIGVNLDQLVFNKSYQTANGIVFGASVKLKELKIPPIIFYDLFASVNNNPMETSLLGMSFLKRFKKYEVHQDKLVLSL